MLAQLADGVVLPSLTMEAWDEDEYGRVRFSLFMAIVAEGIPRRLGRDASSPALALDKRLARKVANMYRTLWLGYAKTGWEPPPEWSTRRERLELAAGAEPAMRTAGATVQWPAWLKERKADVKTRRREVAALALHLGLLRWGSRRVGLLSQEIDSIERIAADAVERVRRAA